ncbi:MAG: IMP cyclohydrolase [Oscillospiraceae bacterium]|jgi:hypothetical protein|nr:IMP cyclohydrolase [Oscillospiraceae bacterium]
MLKINDYLKGNAYPGRGIIIGRNRDGRAVLAYFIMGRSDNSRNRVFVTDGDTVRTKAFDESKMTDPSLVIYNAVRTLGNKTIVTNGDQTDTIAELMDKQYSFEQSLRGREFEPDHPNYTPRISGIAHLIGDEFNYALSILKTDSGDKGATLRQTFAYSNPIKGGGHFIHTYKGDGEPLPSFVGEPVKIEISGGIDEFASEVWNSLDESNRISLYVRVIDTASGDYDERIINKNA